MTRESVGREVGVLGRPTRGYVPALDGVRALAVGIVMLSHLGAPGFSGGKTGVLVFFGLSGYLITSILMRELDRTGRMSLRRFYARRFLRLLPAMLLAIAVTVILALVFRSSPDAESSLRSAPFAVLYVVNWTQVAGIDPGWFGHFWSLAVEEQFYLVWPTLLLLAWRWRGALAVAWVALGGAALSILEKQLVPQPVGRQAGTDFAADALLLGCALAAALASGAAWPRAVGRWAFWPAVVAVALASALGDSGGGASTSAYAFFGSVWWPLVAVAGAVVTASLVTGSAPQWVQRLLGSRVLSYLGRISYGMYLWHIILLALISDVVLSNPVRVVALFVTTIAVASASYFLVERPFLRRKRKFEVESG